MKILSTKFKKHPPFIKSYSKVSSRFRLSFGYLLKIDKFQKMVKRFCVSFYVPFMFHFKTKKSRLLLRWEPEMGSGCCGQTKHKTLLL
nr:MAG TPA: hypothetical protein [Caudoviricetes sp.]